MSSQEIRFLLNGQVVSAQLPEVLLSLSDFLRKNRDLTGTKVVCAEGDCGACTVLVKRIESSQSTEVCSSRDYYSINSCLVPLFLLDGFSIVTVEALAKDGQLHPAQQQMVNCFGTQCGFCTPGFVCAMANLHDDQLSRGLSKVSSSQKAKNYLTGNLCRCTGYDSIVDAALNMQLDKSFKLSSRYQQAEQTFVAQYQQDSCYLKSEDFEIILPKSIDEAVFFKKQNSQIKILAGGTDLGVLLNKRRLQVRSWMSLQKIKELSQIEKSAGVISIGANATLAQVEDFFSHENSELSHLLHIFASPQIKNRATLMGNVMNASPIGDSLPFLLVADAELVLYSQDRGERRVKLRDFYLGYKKLDLADDEIALRIAIDEQAANFRFKLYKASNRKDLDISTVTFAARFSLSSKQSDSKQTDSNLKKMFSHLQIYIGGVGPVVLPATNVQRYLLSQDLSHLDLDQAKEILRSEISPRDDLRASKKYRELVAQNFLEKFLYEVVHD